MVKAPMCYPTARCPLLDWQHLWTGPVSDSSLCSPHSPAHGRKVGKYLLSERTNFWRKGKREFQTLKTKDPAPRCNWATGQRWTCPGAHRRSKECFIPKKHWSQTIQSEVKPASLCLLQVEHTCLSSAKVAAILNKSRCFWVQTALNASILRGKTCVHHGLEKLDLWSQEAILNF